MTTLENWVQTPLASALGWTLFHSLWEGAIVALVLLVALRLIRSAHLRYIAACAAMLFILAGFAVTLLRLWPEQAGAAATIVRGSASVVPNGAQWLPDMSARLRAADILPWFTPFWIAGVVLFQLRGLVSWMAARRLRWKGVCSAPAIWQQRLVHLREGMQVSRPVALLESCLTNVPVVMGHLRPAILVPIGMLAGMPANQIEGILLHELAHIRRRDYLVNLVQMIVESFLFYHPAIWWISAVIRAERENCCDDLAVGAGDVRQYAAALTALEENRWATQEAALAATGGDLVKRMRRLLDPSREAPRAVLTPLLSAAILTLTAALALTAWQTQAPVQSQSAPLATPWQKWMDEDVLYLITPSERNAFLKLKTDGERESFVEQFWLQRNPTPGTEKNEFKEEHYRRIAFANEHFASRIAGWKTDRGRIYIVYGPPDEIDSHPVGGLGVNGTRTYPFEDWRYRNIDGIGKDVLMEFADPNRTGELHMTTDPSKN